MILLARSMPAGRAFYFGTYQQPGHYLHDDGWNSIQPENPHQGVEKIKWGPLPWRNIDGGLCAKRARQGEAALHHKDGWTALAFPNYIDDSRGGSNSVFFFEGSLCFEEALTEARRRFRHVMERIDAAFEVKLVAVNTEARAACL